MKLLFSILLASSLFVAAGQAQSADLPQVFMLGEHEDAYEKVKQQYSRTLLEVSDYDTQAAFGNWMQMMQAMEEHAEKLKFDLKGVKLWLHAFWGADGSLQHIGYLLRPDSRNVESLQVAAFLKTFMKKYEFPLTSSREFSHYTGANFPIYSERSSN